MRTTISTRTSTMLIAACVAALAIPLAAQDPVPPPVSTPGRASAPGQLFGTVDFGFRTDDIDGDEARYFRFRDLRGGPFLDGFRLGRETESLVLRAEASNVGYRDQRYFGQFERIGRLRGSFEWNQIPLYLSRDAESLYVHQGNGVLSIDGLRPGDVPKANENTWLPLRRALLTLNFRSTSRFRV